MTMMSKVQRTAVLDFHNGVNAKGNTMIVKHSSTIDVMVREGWARRPGGMTKRLAAVYPPSARRTAYVTRAGLIAAGVDMDAIHAEALAEENDRNWVTAGGNLDTREDVQAGIADEVEQMLCRATSRAEQQAYNLLHTGGLAAFDARYGATASTAINAWADQGKIKVRHTPTGMTVQTFKKYANNDLEIREQCGNPAAHESHVWDDQAPRGGQRWCSGGPITPAEQRTGVSDVQASIADEVPAEAIALVGAEFLRRWPKIEGPPNDLQVVDLLDAQGRPVERWWRGVSYTGYWEDVSGLLKRQTWSQIRARGEVVEVQRDA